MTLSDFIADTLSEPFEWGQNDCALWCASAALACTGFDPAADLRGTYNTWFGCRRVIMKAGGLEALIAPRMERFDPLTGDGVAIVRIADQTICAVIMSGRAHVKKKDGSLMIAERFEEIRGWSW
ncbi:DUF6950 family protein [Shimia sp.]|uniref:DUF6950 family protein n=1 Tax=Shimia sp. TaxID=1954381 RepID=UPI003BADB2A5